MQVITRSQKHIEETIEIPEGAGRVDCSCGAVIKMPSHNRFNHAEVMVQHGCPECQARFPLHQSPDISDPWSLVDNARVYG